MFKRLLATFSLVFMLSPAVAKAEFSDVSDLDSYAMAVETLVTQGVLEGYPDGTFLPEQEVTRAEAVKIILLGMGIAVDEGSIAAAVFSDVSQDDWFFAHVGTAVSLGLIQGYDDNTFRPHQTVNRAEALKILTLAADVNPASPTEPPFADVAIEAWFAPYANHAKLWNVEPPQRDGHWHAADAISRGNISEMVYRMQQVESTGKAFEESKNWLRKRFATVDVTLKVPFKWNMKGDGVGAVWLLDKENGQWSLLDPYANGATLLMTRNLNSEGLSASALLDRVRAGLKVDSARGRINGLEALTVYTLTGDLYREWYVVLDNGNLLHFQGLRGEGPYAPFLEGYLEDVVSSVEFEENADVDPVEAARSAIMVDGSGQDVLDLFDDLILFETDTIGVGTGPVDYFYSPEFNITLKYERSFDVILDIREGQTSAF